MATCGSQRPFPAALYFLLCPVEVYLNWTSEEGLIHVRLGFGFPFLTLFGQGSRPQSDTFLTSK